MQRSSKETRFLLVYAAARKYISMQLYLSVYSMYGSLLNDLKIACVVRYKN